MNHTEEIPIKIFQDSKIIVGLIFPRIPPRAELDESLDFQVTV